MAALLVIAQIWKHSKHPSAGEGVNKLCKVEPHLEIKEEATETTGESQRHFPWNEDSRLKMQTACWGLNCTLFPTKYAQGLTLVETNQWRQEGCLCLPEAGGWENGQ